MTIKLNTERCRSTFRVGLSKKKRFSTKTRTFIEHPTYYEARGEILCFPKLYYSLENGNLYTIYNDTDYGDLYVLNTWKVI